MKPRTKPPCPFPRGANSPFHVTPHASIIPFASSVIGRTNPHSHIPPSIHPSIAFHLALCRWLGEHKKPFGQMPARRHTARVKKNHSGPIKLDWLVRGKLPHVRGNTALPEWPVTRLLQVLCGRILAVLCIAARGNILGLGCCHATCVFALPSKAINDQDASGPCSKPRHCHESHAKRRRQHK